MHHSMTIHIGADARPVRGLGRREWPDVRGSLRTIVSRAHGLDNTLAEWLLAVLFCGMLAGALVGGFMGYMDAAAPAVDAPGSLTQLAISDVGWTAMARQQRVASHHLCDLLAGAPESSWQHLIGCATADSESRGRIR